MKKYIIIQILFLCVIQWASISVIILNALALTSVKRLGSQGYILVNSREFILIIMGTLSLLVASIILCMYINLCFNMLQSDRTILPSTRLLGCEVGMSICVICVWLSYNIVIVSHFNTASVCHHLNTDMICKITLKACSLVDAMITVGFITISLWFLIVLLSIHTMLELNEHPVNELFTMQTAVHPYDRKCIISYVPSTDNYRHYSTSTKGSRATAVPEYIAARSKSKDYLKDIQFTPVQIDLMLPSASELMTREQHY